jgi:hypothetical protein
MLVSRTGIEPAWRRDCTPEHYSGVAKVYPSEPAELVEDEARHDERDKLLLDHFLDNANDRRLSLSFAQTRADGFSCG